MHYNIYSHR